VLIKAGVDIRKVDELEEAVENEINRLWKSGATLKNAVKAGARLRKSLKERKNADKSGS